MYRHVWALRRRSGSKTACLALFSFSFSAPRRDKAGGILFSPTRHVQPGKRPKHDAHAWREKQATA
jgi:hypothetical protein